MSDEIHGVAAIKEIELPFDGELKITLTPREERDFRDKYFEIPNGKKCWVWTGAKLDGSGYGVFAMNRLKKPAMKAHRLSYLAFVGPIPRGHQVCHACDVRDCVNPAHLWVGTSHQNMADLKAKDKQSYGEKNVKAVLSDEDVFAMREEWSKRPLGKTERFKRALIKKRMSIRYKITVASVNNLLAGDTWSHVGGPIADRAWERKKRAG